MGTMLFTFTTNMTPEENAAAIKNTISRMGGSTKGSNANFAGKFRIPKGWKPEYHTLFKSKCRFYVGRNGVRAVLQTTVYALESTNQLQKKEFGMHLLGCSWRFTLNALPI